MVQEDLLVGLLGNIVVTQGLVHAGQVVPEVTEIFGCFNLRGFDLGT